MGREVVSKRDIRLAQEQRDRLAAEGGLLSAAPDKQREEPSNYSERLIQYVPAEVVAVYLAVENGLKTVSDQSSVDTLLWMTFVFLLIMTPAYLWRIQNVKKVAQLVISTLSFAVWVFTLGGPFADLAWYEPIFGTVLLPLYTFGAGIIVAEKGAPPSVELPNQ